MRLLSALALTVAVVLAMVFSSCGRDGPPIYLPVVDGGVSPHNPNDALNHPVDSTFFPDAAPFEDAQQTGFPDSSF
ncbi:MAG TPA: hypothetical protein VGL61_24830 [Kofleriaceae bacterium]|jgi:hypothetical protein